MLAKILITCSCAAALLMAPDVTNAQQSLKDSLTAYYGQLLDAGTPEGRTEVDAGIKKLGASSNEEEVDVAISLLHLTRRSSQADSLTTVAAQRFPNSKYQRLELVNAVRRANDAAGKIALFNQWRTLYADSTYEGLSTSDNMRSIIAARLTDDKNYTASALWVDSMSNDFFRAGSVLRTAGLLVYYGDEKAALDLYKNATAREARDTMVGDMVRKDAFCRLAIEYAALLYKHKQYKDALTYISIVRDWGVRGLEEKTDRLYVSSLFSNGKAREALPLMEQMIRGGKADNNVRNSLKEVYIKVKGSDKGFVAYEAELTSHLRKQLADSLKTKMLDMEAPVFALKDIDGRTVDLASLKGKTVILDFWATWCIPCIQSFPTMNRAMQHYKNDPDIKFLYIDCGEQTEDPVKTVRKYLATTPFKFHVLMDVNTAEGASAKYKVKGIPQKFIIDKAGKLRFALTGFDPAEDKALEELKLMIDIVKG